MDSSIKQCVKRTTKAGMTAEAPVQEFAKWKASSLGKVDLSKKGSVDEQISGLVGFINEQTDYFTTSSCSGRILICSDNPLLNESEYAVNAKANSKRDCVWYFVSHTSVEAGNILQVLENIDGPSKFKFEPFVLHVQCRTLESAKVLHRASFEAGFRNSGISFGKGGRKIIAATRGTACLEAPMTDDEGSQLIADSYVSYIAKQANQKLESNLGMIKKFQNNLSLSLRQNASPEPPPKGSCEVYRRKGKVSKKNSCRSTPEVIEMDSSCLFDA